MVLLLIRDPLDPHLQDLDPVRPEDHSVLPGSGLHIAEMMVSQALKNELPMATAHHLPRIGKKFHPPRV